MRTRRRSPHNPSRILLAGIAAGLLSAPQHTNAANTNEAADAANESAATNNQATPIRFTFKDAPLDQVLDFFARESGLPIIQETDIPQGTVTFISNTAYDLPEALRVLNTILRTRGLLLRRDRQFLYLGKVGDMQTAPVPTFEGQLPEDVNGEEIVTLVIPLQNASATPVSENLKGLIGSYGSIVAMPNQNTVVLTESAAQVRRLKSIIAALDDDPPFQESVSVFKLEHIRAKDALESLKVLVAQKQVTVVFDQQGNRRVVEDEQIAGVRLEADNRTNSVIALGSEARLATVAELVTIIDQPDNGATQREMVTFTLAETDANEAANNLNRLYAKLPDDERPTVLPLPTLGKLTVIGSIANIDEAARFVREVDGPDSNAGGTPDTTRRSSIIALDNAAPPQVISTLNNLLSPRERRALRYTPLPGRDALILVGPARDVDAAAALITQIDAEPAGGRVLRIITLERPLTPAILDRALRLYDEQPEHGRIDVIEQRQATGDGDSRRVATASLRATPNALASLDRIIRELQSADRAPLVTRTFEIASGDPAAVARRLAELARTMLEQDGAPFEAPRIQPVDELGLVVVRARADQMPAIENLVPLVDDANQPNGAQPLRLFRVRAADVNAIATLLRDRYNQRPQATRREIPVDIKADVNTNTLIVQAHPDVIPDIESFVQEVNAAGAGDADRVTEIFPLKVAKAQDLARAMQSLYPAPPPPVDRRGRPMTWLQQPREVNVSADPASNSLIVDAPAERIPAFKALVDKLDRVELPPQATLRTYDVDRADIAAVARTLQNLARAGSLSRPAERSGQRVPVTIEPDTASNTLIVAGDETTHQIVARLLADLDAPADTSPSNLIFFDLNNARAERIAPTVQQILADRFDALIAGGQIDARPGGFPRDAVTPDAATNTLIIAVPEPLAAVAREVVTRLDAPARQAGANVVRVVRLDFADAADAAPALQRSLAQADLPSGGTVSVNASPRSKALIVSGAEADVVFVEELVAELDQPPADDRLEVRTVYLEHNRAEPVARVVEQVLGGESLPDWWRFQLRREGRDTGERMSVKVAAEPRANAVVITAAPALIAVAEELVKQLDSPKGTAEHNRPVTVIALVNADAAEVAANLQAVLNDAPDASPDPAPTIRVDNASNALIARGTAQQLQRIQQLAQQLDDTALAATRDIRSVLVDRSRTDADTLAATIRQLLQQQGVPVRVISADELTNPAQPEQPEPDTTAPATDDKEANGGILLPKRLRFVLRNFHQTVIAQITPQDTPTTTDDAPEPASIDMTKLVAEARALLDADATTDAEANATPQPASTTADAAEPEPVTLAVDPTTNRLVVLGSSVLTERIAKLAADLQAQLPPEPSTIRVVKLPDNANAGNIFNLLRATLAQIGRASDANPNGTTGNVAVIPDNASSSLIISANDTDFRTVSELIAALSNPTEVDELAVRAFPLSNVRADLAFRSLNTLLNQRTRTSPNPGEPVEISVANDQGEEISATIPFGSIRVVAGPSDASLIVSGPARAFPVIRRFVELVDKSPSADTGLTRLYNLDNADAPALARTLRNILNSDRIRSRNRTVPASVFDDRRTNTIIVTASDAQHAQIDSLIQRLDRSVEEDAAPLEIIPVSSAAPSALARVIQRTVIGNDAGRAAQVSVTADDTLNVLLVRAPDTERAEIDAILRELDRPDVAELPIRSIKLERADATVVAAALERFFRDRARASTNPGQRAKQPRVAVSGDARTGTLLVAASDNDFQEVQRLISTFDAPGGTDEIEYRVIRLQNARVEDIIEIVNNIAGNLEWSNSSWMRGNRPARTDQVIVRENTRDNSIVVVGSGEFYETIESIVAMLDTPLPAEGSITARVLSVPNGNLRAIRDAANEALGDPMADRFWWADDDPSRIRFSIDEASRSIIAVGPAAKVEQAAEFIAQLNEGLEGPEQGVETVELAFANAFVVADAVNRFFQNRARIDGQRTPAVSAVGSWQGTVLLLTGKKQDLELAVDIAARFDKPDDAAEDRSLEVIPLAHADPRDAVRAVRELFPRSRSTGRQPVIATPELRTSSIVISAPAELFAEVKALIARLDTPNADQTVTLKTFTLQTARAAEVATTLRETLNLDAQGRPVPGENGEIRRFINDQGSPIEVAAAITPDQRSNTLLVSADPDSLALIESLIAQLDDQPAVSSTEYRTFTLKHELASDAAAKLRTLLRNRTRNTNEPAPNITSDSEKNTVIVSATPDRIEEIARLLTELDTPPDTPRRTEFVKLESADAQQVRSALSVFFGPFASAADTPGARAVSITADTTTNSLVISANEDQWPRLDELIAQLDNEAYDPSRRLEVIPLTHADASSVATAIQAAFDRTVQARLEAEQQRAEREAERSRNDPFYFPSLNAPDTLVEAEEFVSVSPEPVTNSLIISAGQRELERIRQIVTTLDVPGSAGLPAPVIIPLEAGRAEDIAVALRQIYDTNRRGSRRDVTIAPSNAANALVVRAPDDQLEELRALAESLARGSQVAGVAVRTLRLNTQPATRLAQTLRQTFTTKAQRDNEPFTITADARSNALIVTSSKRLFDELQTVALALDPPRPQPEANNDDNDQANADPLSLPALGPGQTLRIVPLKHIAPDIAAAYLDELGLTVPQPLDRPGLVGEPVRAVTINEQSALAIIAQPIDMPIVTRLLQTLDNPSANERQRLAIVRLKTAEAPAVVEAVRRMLDAARDDAGTSLAASLAEQIRRLSLRGETATAPDLNIDLNQPIRIDPEPQSNAVIIASTPANTRALEQLIGLLDRLPVGDAVMVRIFHLENGSAERTANIVRQLFSQGEAIRRSPGTNIQGLPTTETGRALAGDIAVATDDRTNALVVAGREEAVALAEVLISQLDAAENDNWIEPRIIPLTHADPTRIADTLNRVVVQGMGDTPDSVGIQQQVGRLRLINRDAQADIRQAFTDIRGDRFAPLTRLVILAEDTLNAVIAVGSPSNLEVIEALITQLDVEAASRDALVRLYPLQHAAADRVAELLEDLFRDQINTDNLAERDSLAVQADSRTNTLIVATSPRSFAIVENLLKTLDTPNLNPTVSITVIPVENAPADELADSIERLMQDRLRANSAGQPSPRDIVSIQAADSSNALIVAASKENLAIIEDLVRVLSDNAQLGASSKVEVIQLDSADAEQMADTLQELYADKANETRGSRDAVRITPDTRLNAVLVTGSEQDIRELKRLAASLDGQSVSAVREIRIFPLDSANALEMTNLLNNILTGRRAGQSDRQATILRFARSVVGDDDLLSEAEISRAIRERVSIEPELRTNAVVVSAPPRMMLLIEALIDDIDSSAEGARTIEVFKLENADAENMRDLLVELFNLQQQGNLFVLVPAGVNQNPDDPNQNPNELTFSTVPDQRQQLSITVDLRTNSLLVSGSPTYLERVAEIIRQLDAQQGTEREQITYELKNALVEEVAGALQQFIQIEQDRISRLLGPDRSGSLQRRLEREISVVGVPGSSRLILSASPRYMERVRSLIDELDTPPKQVLIQVLIAEVTLDNEDTFGIDASFQGAGSRDFGGNYTALGTPLLTSLGVPNLSVSSLDFSVFVRALQVQGRLEILSRPQILVNDNQIANIQVGDEIQLVQNVERLDDGRTVSDVEPRDLGVILEVEPSISPDNSVRLNIAPEISTLTNRTTQVSSDFEAPVISERTARTTVTVRDGETIVIGGLIESSTNIRTAKVPIIGDIPLLGELFRSRDEEKRRTELLILLTPRVIVNPEDIRLYSDVEVDRLSITDETKAQLRRNDIGLDETEFAGNTEGPLTRSSDNRRNNDDDRPAPRPANQAPAREPELQGFELPL